MDIIKYAESVILSTYGDSVSVDRKSKVLIKFGRNEDIDTGSDETVWVLGGHEVYQAGNTIDTVSSSSALDTGSVTIEGHTVDGNGDFTFVVQSATLDGQNKVTLTTPLARASRLYNTGSTDFNGSVYVYRDTSITSGTPDDLSFAHLEADLDNNQKLVKMIILY